MSRFAIFTERYGGEIAVNVDRIFTAFQDDETFPVHLLMSEASSKDGVIEYEVQGSLRDVVNKLNGDNERREK